MTSLISSVHLRLLEMVRPRISAFWTTGNFFPLTVRGSMLCLIDLKSVRSSLHLSALRSNRGSTCFYIQGQRQPEAGQRVLERYYVELIVGSTTPTILSKFHHNNKCLVIYVIYVFFITFNILKYTFSDWIFY